MCANVCIVAALYSATKGLCKISHKTKIKRLNSDVPLIRQCTALPSTDTLCTARKWSWPLLTVKRRCWAVQLLVGNSSNCCCPDVPSISTTEKSSNLYFQEYYWYLTFNINKTFRMVFFPIICNTNIWLAWMEMNLSLLNKHKLVLQKICFHVALCKIYWSKM